MPATGGEQIVRELVNQGLTTVFAVPGTQNVPLFESLRTSKVRTILAASELGAAFMANGYYRACGSPAAVVTISGPGLLLALAGIEEARHDSVGLIHIIVDTVGEQERRFRLQAIDLERVSAAFYKRHFSIKHAAEAKRTISEALYITVEGEPGPVLVSVQYDALIGESDERTSDAARVEIPGKGVALTPELREFLSRSERPVLLLGQGAQRYASQILDLIENLQCPIVTNCSGRGVVSDEHRLNVCSDFSGWGAELVSQLFASADCVIALGCKFTHNGSSGYCIMIDKEKFVHIDTSAGVLDANYPARFEVQGDVGDFVKHYRQISVGRERPKSQWTDAELLQWRKRFSDARAVAAEQTAHIAAAGQHPADFFRILREVLPPETIIVTDSGNHQILTRRYFPVLQPRGLIVPSDFQSMGYGIPASVGTRLAKGNASKVVAIVGDGGLRMTGLELSTAVREKLDLAVIVFNDGYLGQIRTQQLREYGTAYATNLGAVNLEKLADAIGASYFSLADDVRGSLAEALVTAGVKILELPIKETSQARREQRVARSKSLGRKLFGGRLISWLKRLR